LDSIPDYTVEENPTERNSGILSTRDQERLHDAIGRYPKLTGGGLAMFKLAQNRLRSREHLEDAVITR
jgi:hypothetical protein